MKWEPIKTFPADTPFDQYGDVRFYRRVFVFGNVWASEEYGEPDQVLGEWTATKRVAIGTTRTGGDWFRCDTYFQGEDDLYIKATHWMPLPKAPE